MIRTSKTNNVTTPTFPIHPLLKSSVRIVVISFWNIAKKTEKIVQNHAHQDGFSFSGGAFLFRVRDAKSREQIIVSRVEKVKGRLWTTGMGLEGCERKFENPWRVSRFYCRLPSLKRKGEGKVVRIFFWVVAFQKFRFRDERIHFGRRKARGGLLVVGKNYR